MRQTIRHPPQRVNCQVTRRLITRGGRLQKRHETFQETSLSALDDYGSMLLGAWEVVIGPEAVMPTHS